MGGVWALIRARSVAEVSAVFPEFTVLEIRPAWMTHERYAEIEPYMHRLDVDDGRPRWLNDPQQVLEELLPTVSKKKKEES